MCKFDVYWYCMLCCPMFTISFCFITRLEIIIEYNFRPTHFIALFNIGTVFITSHFCSKSAYSYIFVFVGSIAKRVQKASFFDEDCRLATRIRPRVGFNQSTINYKLVVRPAVASVKRTIGGARHSFCVQPISALNVDYITMYSTVRHSTDILREK